MIVIAGNITLKLKALMTCNYYILYQRSTYVSAKKALTEKAKLFEPEHSKV